MDTSRMIAGPSPAEVAATRETENTPNSVKSIPKKLPMFHLVKF